jgi:hypothetical protein
MIQDNESASVFFYPSLSVNPNFQEYQHHIFSNLKIHSNTVSNLLLLLLMQSIYTLVSKLSEAQVKTAWHGLLIGSLFSNVASMIPSSLIGEDVTEVSTLVHIHHILFNFIRNRKLHNHTWIETRLVCLGMRLSRVLWRGKDRGRGKKNSQEFTRANN